MFVRLLQSKGAGVFLVTRVSVKGKYLCYKYVFHVALQYMKWHCLGAHIEAEGQKGRAHQKLYVWPAGKVRSARDE